MIGQSKLCDLRISNPDQTRSPQVNAGFRTRTAGRQVSSVGPRVIRKRAVQRAVILTRAPSSIHWVAQQETGRRATALPRTDLSARSTLERTFTRLKSRLPTITANTQTERRASTRITSFTPTNESKVCIRGRNATHRNEKITMAMATSHSASITAPNRNDNSLSYKIFPAFNLPELHISG